MIRSLYKQSLIINVSTVLILGISLGLIFFKYAGFGVDGAKTFAQQATNITAQAQPDSPLRISNILNNSMDPGELEISFTVENVGDSAITAFTIRYVDYCGKSRSGGFNLNNILTKDRILMPRQTILSSLADFGCSEPLTRVVIIVDYVEFENGKHWGEDRFKTGERLAGTRAGAKDETRAIQQAADKGGEAILRRINSDNNDWSIPANHSEAWVTGYNSGRRFRRGQVKRAYIQNGMNGITQTLQTPYDAFDAENDK